MSKINSKKPIIKIFVSHRIDLDSEVINNPLFIPVRCGAVLDKRKDKLNIIGDDTGDNISEKRLSYNELTVQYWAWKNVKADYYGLCHYRRYLSFITKPHNKHCYRFLLEDYLSEYSIRKYKLNDQANYEKLIKQYDILVPLTIDISKIPTNDGFGNNVIDHWNKIGLMDISYIKKMQKIVEEQYPQYGETMCKYLKGKEYRAHNMFIMRSELFNELCDFQFDILKRMEKEVDNTNYCEVKNRIYGFLGELLLDVFVFHQEWKKKQKIKELQTVFFKNTEKQQLYYPNNIQRNLPICLISSNEYVPYLFCTVKSILSYANNQQEYNFVVLSNSITRENKEKLRVLIKKENQNTSIQFFNPDVLIDDSKIYKRTADDRKKSYYHLYIPWILKMCERALLIEADVIAKSNISCLFTEDITDYYVAGVNDIAYKGLLNTSPKVLRYARKEMGMSDPYKYINTGVMLMNLEKIRTNFTLNDVLNCELKRKFTIPVQDQINSLFDGKIKLIDLKWNFYVKTNSWVEKMIFNAPAESSKYYSDCMKPVMIHWANQPKPWNDPGMPYAEEFWRVARTTDFYEEILARMTKGCSNDFATNLIQSGDIVYYMPLHKVFIKSIKKIIDKLVTPFLPKGSERRMFVSQYYRKILKTLKLKKE